MTIIAWDGVTLAADKLNLSSYGKNTITKIHKVICNKKPMLIGISGKSVLITPILNWARTNFKPELIPKEQLDPEASVKIICIHQDKKIYIFENAPYSYTVEDDVAAIGSGDQMALGVMYHGGDSIEAVNICSERGILCGNGVDTLTF